MSSMIATMLLLGYPTPNRCPNRGLLWNARRRITISTRCCSSLQPKRHPKNATL
ncbi:hypothetical protein CsSME_00037882 [Camellia sinensis var. sinensis]